jgi:manganese transport protein
MLAVGIIGATVMPHAIFLHSALTQNRVVARDDNQKRRLFRFELADVMIALPLAGLINASMLIMAAATFHTNGYMNIAQSEDLVSEAYRTLEPLLGSAASVIFGISLLAAGLSSSAVGTMAGQVIMQGYLHFQIPIWIRRLVTMLPAFVVIWLGVKPTAALVFSQVVLSFGIPFALIPLVIFTMRRDLMGVLTNHKITTVVAWAVATVIVGLNLYFLAAQFFL